MTASTVDEKLVQAMTALRRELHQEPELGLDLPRTQKKVLEALSGLPLDISLGKGLTSITAVLRGGAAEGSDRSVVLLRADMDALPLTEPDGVEYASRVPGAMHACGHDLHTAMLVGAAHLLCARQAELAGDVVFMFQPGEEGFGGAGLMIEEGVLDAAGSRPVAAYALHVASAMLPAGLLTTRKGPLLAGGDALDVTVRGQGGHDSQPQLLRDPIVAASEMVLALRNLAKERGADDPVIVSVGSFHAGSAANVIPDDVELKVGIRSFRPDTKARIVADVTGLLERVAEAHGVRVEVERTMDYPVTMVDGAEADFAAETVAEVLGPNRLMWSPTPLAASEDFSLILGQIPGALLFLGACPADRDPRSAPFNHAAGAAFRDDVLWDGARLLAGLAERRVVS